MPNHTPDHMPYIITLVAADPRSNMLSASLIEEICQYLSGERISSAPYAKWLRDDIAAEFEIGAMLSMSRITHLRDMLAERKIDIFCQPNENRRKKLLLADMDSTIVTGETLDDLAESAGIGEKIAAITARAMNGELDFIEAIRERVAMLADLPASLIDDLQKDLRLNDGAENFVQTMRNHGATCVLVSGGFTVFTGSIAPRAGFHHHHGNILGIENDKMTGLVHDPILDRDTKLTLLKDYAEKQNLSLEQTLTIGDGANDLAMLSAAGLGIGYHAKDMLRAEIPNHIVHGDLTAALYAQGFSHVEFDRNE